VTVLTSQLNFLIAPKYFQEILSFENENSCKILGKHAMTLMQHFCKYGRTKIKEALNGFR